MNAQELIGAVVVAHLRHDYSLAADGGGDISAGGGVSRYMLHKLAPEHAASICEAIAGDSLLAAITTLRIPRGLVQGFAVPESAITEENAAYSRNAPCDTPLLLLANHSDDLADTLRDVQHLGAPELKSNPEVWATAAQAGLTLPQADIASWTAALSGLLAAENVSLDQFARYVALTRSGISNGLPLIDALGWALPVVHLPRDSANFRGIKPTDQNNAKKWSKHFQQLIAKRRPLLQKRSGGRSGIDRDALRERFEVVKDSIPSHAHPAIEAFLDTPPGWLETSDVLAELEWESDQIQLLFEGIKIAPDNLGSATMHFFEFHHPDSLTASDKEYLEGLARRRSSKDPREDDIEFFERFRTLLGQERQLRAKWERFVYGRGIEHNDFLVGLLLGLQKLHQQADSFVGRKQLHISTQHHTKAQWLSVNADLLASFATRYRGIVALTEHCIKWDTHYLFKPEDLAPAPGSSRRPHKKNTSTARAATHIKFNLDLHIGRGVGANRVSTQVTWLGRPNAIGSDLRDDLARACARPFVKMTVQQRSVSKKGRLQCVSLADTGSLEPAYNRDAGTLVGPSSAREQEDLAKTWSDALGTANREGRLTAADTSTLRSAWEDFRQDYSTALKAWQEVGLNSQAILKQAASYEGLLKALVAHARGDRNRHDLWEPILKVGIAEVCGAAPSAIIAPWHPLRLVASALKLRSMTGLLNHALSASDVTFGDDRLFFTDLASELEHPYYPEVVLGQRKGTPLLLTVTDTLNEYSLAESPVVDLRDPRSNATGDNASGASSQVGAMVNRYLDLQPHEHANLSLALYNCDSVDLPLATVAKLSSLNEDDEIRCNVILRHYSTEKLGQVYSQLLESVDSDPDALVASETSRDFMAKLRIAIMLNPNISDDPTAGKSVDIAFLQDVVARRADIRWLETATDHAEPLLRHVPPRWAYRRSASADELKSTAYLTCPRQPSVGWAYLSLLNGVVSHVDPHPDARTLPARQIVFLDAGISSLFAEVHNLAEWVVNYDDLLDKRQLKNQGINVIRYQRQRSHGRNLIVSSTSPLRLLRVLVRRRLEELDLGLSTERVDGLAARLMSDASDVSGDILLRAAKRGVFAGELIGVVLSKALIEEELGKSTPTSWFFLDDYATWLGQREGRIADLLAISPTQRDGRTVLRVIVTEAKYVGAPAVSEARRSSQEQLFETTERIQDALFGDPGRLDRDLWLARLSDLLLDSGGSIAPDTAHLETLRDGVRGGTTSIDLRGYSHIFVSGPPDAPQASEHFPLPGVAGNLQEVFGRETLKSILLAYEREESLLSFREQLGPERPWTRMTDRTPTPPVTWITGDEGLAPRSPNTADEDDDGGSPSTPNAPTGPIIPVGDQHLSLPDTSDTRVMPLGAPEALAPVSHITSHPPAALPYGAAFNGVIATMGRELVPTRNDVEWLAETDRRLRSALLGYRMSARSLGSRLTPNAALIRLQGSDTMSVELVERRRSELLTTHGLRIIGISGRPGEVVVAVARDERETVPLWKVLAQRLVNRDRGGLNTSFILGIREIDGELLYLNLGRAFGGAEQHAPHTLVAGATGSGKSVLLQNLILDICATNPPSLAQIHLIDPKFGVDYPAIRLLPHLRGGIITDQDEARDVLKGLVAEMQRRYKVFAAEGVNSLESYNTTRPGAERLPALFVVHDEFAEWMLTEDYKAAVSDVVARLGVMARAAGIYLIFAAQRPDKDVFPMQLRENLGNRLVLRVQGAGTSEIALGSKGAELLLGKGHLAARLSGEPDLIMAQVPFLSTDDLRIAANAIKEDCR